MLDLHEPIGCAQLRKNWMKTYALCFFTWELKWNETRLHEFHLIIILVSVSFLKVIIDSSILKHFFFQYISGKPIRWFGRKTKHLIFLCMQHCVLASCRTMKEDEDCEAEYPSEYLGYPCISKDIETSNWCKQTTGEEINASRVEEDSHSHTEPLMSTQEAKRDFRRQAFSSYKLQMLTMLNNCYKLQQLTLNSWFK